MKKDIEIPKVADVHIAAVKEIGEDLEEVWNVYLINQQRRPLEKVLIASTGYKKDPVGHQKERSSTLRHFFEVIPAQSSQKIEPIIEEVFHLNNEYFVTFFTPDGLHEKKFVFLPETIQVQNFTVIPLLNKKGVLI